MVRSRLRLLCSRARLALPPNPLCFLGDTFEGVSTGKNGRTVLFSITDIYAGRRHHYHFLSTSPPTPTIRCLPWAGLAYSRGIPAAGFCRAAGSDTELEGSSEDDELLEDPSVSDDCGYESSGTDGHSSVSGNRRAKKRGGIKDAKKKKGKNKKAKNTSAVDFTKVDKELLPTVLIIGRPNVGKSALYNRLIRRREALVYNTPDDHVTRDIREGIAKLADLRFRVLDSAGLETEATSGSVLGRTAGMTASVLSRSQFAIFLIDVRSGLQPLDLEVGKWLRKNAPGLPTILAMNKSESLDDRGILLCESAEAHALGFGDPIAISAETGFGMAELYEALKPMLEDYMLQLPAGQLKQADDDTQSPTEFEGKLPLQLAIVGRPNVGKSTLLNTLLQEQRVLVGPEAGLTRDAIRAQFKFEDRIIYLVDTAGWLHRSGKEKGPGSLSIIQSRKNLMRAHIVALVLDAEEIAKARNSMKHVEVMIARQAIEEGRGLVVIVNKMDLLRRQQSSMMHEVMDAVPKQIHKSMPQVPVVFVSALEGKGRVSIMQTVVDTYEKWCLRLPTSRLNRWLVKIMSRHSWKGLAAQPKIKYFTQIKARPPTFVAFVTGKKVLTDANLKFLTKSLKEDFDLGGVPIRIIQRSVLRKITSVPSHDGASGKVYIRDQSDKRKGEAESSNS